MFNGRIFGIVFCFCILAVTCASVSGTKCKDGTDLSQYEGQVAVTDGGRPCQKWAKKKPHAHNFTKDDNFPLDGSAKAAVNFCRNVDNDPLPWCYTRDTDVRWQYCSETICGVDGPTCGGTVKSSSGWLASIDRDNNGVYDRYRDCLWILKAPEDRRIRIEINEMDVQRSKQCSVDYLQIYESSANYGKLCGQSEMSLTSLSNWLYVRWYARGGIGKGFNLTYIHIDKEMTSTTSNRFLPIGGVTVDPPSRPVRQPSDVAQALPRSTSSPLTSGSTMYMTSSAAQMILTKTSLPRSSTVFSGTVIVNPTSENGLTTPTTDKTGTSDVPGQGQGAVGQQNNGVRTTDVTSGAGMIHMTPCAILIVLALISLA